MSGAALPPGLWERIRQMIRDEVGKLLRSGFLRSASIGEGGLTVREGFIRVQNDDGTVTTLYIGGILPAMPDGSTQRGMILRREDGSIAMALYDPNPADGFKQFLALYDRGGKQTVVDDTESGQGLARPYLPFAFYQTRAADWPTTASTTFTTMYRAKGVKQHPRLYVETWANAVDAGAVGEVQILVNGNVWGAPQASTPGFVTGLNFGPAAVDGDHMSTVTIEVQARLASGTGDIRVGVARVEGRQS